MIGYALAYAVCATVNLWMAVLSSRRLREYSRWLKDHEEELIRGATYKAILNELGYAITEEGGFVVATKVDSPVVREIMEMEP